MSIYQTLEPLRKHVPQKVRFVVGMATLFPVLAVVLFFGVNRRLVLALLDIGKDAYRGKFSGSPDQYVVARMNE